MDKKIEQYADALYLSALLESGKTTREARTTFLRNRAGRYNNVTVPMLGGVDIKGVTQIYNEHIGRCMLARFESYRDAFQEAGRVPSAQDFDDIWRNSQDVRRLQIKHAATALKEFVISHGGAGTTPAFVPNENYIETGSAQGHDDVLNLWKIWKAKTQLKPAPTNTQEREKRLDAITSLPDKFEFDNDLAALGSTCNEASPLSLVFMDLDKFKPINDTLGHEAGNRALKAFADVLRRVAEGKGEAYRYGGDEFCVLLPNHSLDEALAVAERICREMQAIRTDELTNGLSTSIGVANTPESTNDSTKLCYDADKAMYESKNAGGNRVSKAESAVATISNP